MNIAHIIVGYDSNLLFSYAHSHGQYKNIQTFLANVASVDLWKAEDIRFSVLVGVWFTRLHSHSTEPYERWYKIAWWFY